MPKFKDLPNELQQYTAFFLDNRRLGLLASVSKNMRKIAKEAKKEKIKSIVAEITRGNPDLTVADANLFAYAQLGLVKYLQKAIKNKDSKANINAKIYFDKSNNIFITPVHIAAYYNSLKCLKLLIESGAKYDYQLSPLHHAASGGSYECVKYLVLEKKVPVDQKSTTSCPLGWNWTPLQMACSNGHDECVEFLIQNKANVELEDPDLYRAIHRACLRNNPKCLELLLQHGAEINVFNEDGVSPLSIAVTNQHEECTRLLLKYTLPTNGSENIEENDNNINKRKRDVNNNIKGDKNKRSKKDGTNDLECDNDNKEKNETKVSSSPHRIIQNKEEEPPTLTTPKH